MVNTFLNQDRAFLVGKNSGKTHPLNPPAAVCKKNEVHQTFSCGSCHSAWAPKCIGCHNQFDPKAQGYDLLNNGLTSGEWVEYVGQFLAGPPTLGVREGEIKKTEPTMPRMIMTIDKTGFETSNDSIIFHRLFAPVAPHTTSIIGRSCKSCHNDPIAIGYGRGELSYEIYENFGRWYFNPKFANNKYDGLPEDAWIEFLKEPVEFHSTRSDFRPFTLEEQKRILTVGACLNCHDENSDIIQSSLDIEFENYKLMLNNQCKLPKW